MKQKGLYHNLALIVFLAAALTIGFSPKHTSAAEKASPKEPVAKTIQNGKDIIVEVNGIKLTREEMDADINKQLELMKKQVPPDQQEQFQPRIEQYKSKLQEALVEKFVLTTLFNQEAQKHKLSVNDEEVNLKIKEMEKSLPAEMTLEKALEMSGTTMEKMRKEIKSGLLAEKIIDAQVKIDPAPSEGEIKTYFENNKKKFNEPEKVHARHILIKTTPKDDDKTKAEKKTKIEALRKELVGGAAFEKIAKENSECPSKAKGGDLGTFARGRMVKAFEDAAFSQKVNEIGPVIETRFGYHVIQALEHTQASAKSLDDVKDKITKTLQQQKKNEAVKKYIDGLKEKAKIVHSGA
jgi:peptidyl-prolyl cis-trans isomerase C